LPILFCLFQANPVQHVLARKHFTPLRTSNQARRGRRQRRATVPAVASCRPC